MGSGVELIEKKAVDLLRGERREIGCLSCREEEARSFAAAKAADVAAVAAISPNVLDFWRWWTFTRFWIVIQKTGAKII